MNRQLFFAASLLICSEAKSQHSRPLVAAAGGYHSLAIGTDGKLWAWGANAQGQLGDGSTLDRPVPSQSAIPPGVIPRAITAGEDHSLMLSEDGRVWACGRNDRGQLGSGSVLSSSCWIEVRGVNRVVQLAAGRNHSTALREDGTVWGWGDNRFGQIDMSSRPVIQTPVQIKGLVTIKSIHAGATHGLAIDAQGHLWSWGDGRFGQLGHGLSKGRSAPAPISHLNRIQMAAGGDGFSLALRSDGSVLAWGRNGHGQLGLGTTRNSESPQVVPDLRGIHWVAAGYEHALAEDKTGTLWSWGDNNLSQLGHSAPSYAIVPMPLPPSAPRPPSGWRIATGAYHTLLYGPNGPVYGFGHNHFNQLGDWSWENRRKPVRTKKDIP